MSSSAQAPESWFEGMAKNIPGINVEYPYRLRVLVCGYRVTPRHRMFEYFLELGAPLLPAIMKHKPLAIAPGTKLLFVLPERHLSVHEQRNFLHRLKTHPQVADIAEVNVITQNPLIVGGVPGECIAMFNIPNDDPDAGLLDQEMK